MLVTHSTDFNSTNLLKHDLKSFSLTSLTSKQLKDVMKLEKKDSKISYICTKNGSKFSSSISSTIYDSDISLSNNSTHFRNTENGSYNKIKHRMDLKKKSQKFEKSASSIILNNIKSRTNCITPTNLHRLPDPRDLTSVDSLNLEMCYFRPIKAVPITPFKRPKSVFIQSPIAIRLKKKKGKCSVFIGPKKGLVPFLLSTSSLLELERCSAFCVYKNFYIVSSPVKLQTLEKLQIEPQTRKHFFIRKCLVKLKKIKLQVVCNLVTSSKKETVSTDALEKKKDEYQVSHNKSISIDIEKWKKSEDIEKFDKTKIRRSKRRIKEYTNQSERQMRSKNKSKENNAILFNKSIKINNESSSIEALTNVNVKATIILENSNYEKETLARNAQEKLDYEYARRLQDQYTKENSIIQPIATRLRKNVAQNRNRK